MNGNGNGAVLVAPTGKYVVRDLTPAELELGIPWLVDRWVRYNRDTARLGRDGDRYFADFLGVQVPEGGFVDSDGRNHQGVDVDGYDHEGFNRHGLDREGYNRNGYDDHGFNRQGLNRRGQTREAVAAEEIGSWSVAKRAAVAAALAKLG